MYLNNPSTANDYAYWIMKYGGNVNVVIIANGTDAKTHKIVALASHLWEICIIFMIKDIGFKYVS